MGRMRIQHRVREVEGRAAQEWQGNWDRSGCWDQCTAWPARKPSRKYSCWGLSEVVATKGTAALSVPLCGKLLGGGVKSLTENPHACIQHVQSCRMLV